MKKILNQMICKCGPAFCILAVLITTCIVLAKLINSSTEDDPKVQISYGKNKTYQISIMDIDVQNATDMEIFALLSYEGYKGRKIPGAINNYSAYQLMKQSDGIELDDEETFTELKRNTVEMIKNIKSY